MVSTVSAPRDVFIIYTKGDPLESGARRGHQALALQVGSDGLGLRGLGLGEGARPRNTMDLPG